MEKIQSKTFALVPEVDDGGHTTDEDEHDCCCAGDFDVSEMSAVTKAEVEQLSKYCEAKYIEQKLEEKNNDAPLHSLDLSHRCCNEYNVLWLGRLCTFVHQLKWLQISYNNLGDDGCIVICQCLRKNYLTTLDLGFTNFGDRAAVELSVRLSKNTSLETLGVSGNKITSVGFKALSNSLLNHPKLVILNCSGNEAKEEGAKSLSVLLKSKGSKLKSIILSGNKIKSEGAKHIGAALSCNPSLTHIDLSDNELGDVGANWIGEALVVQNNKLNRLGLAFNGITDNGMATLCMGLRCCSSLEAFDIGNNMIQNAGCVLLCNELTNLSVTELNVAFNNISTNGIKHIASAILASKTIQSLDLSGNDIISDAADSIYTMLLESMTLKKFSIDHHSIGDIGLRQIASGIASNSNAIMESFSGFLLSPIMIELGSPDELTNMTNENCLKYLNNLWRIVESEAENTNNDAMVDVIGVVDEKNDLANLNDETVASSNLNNQDLVDFLGDAIGDAIGSINNGSCTDGCNFLVHSSESREAEEDKYNRIPQSQFFDEDKFKFSGSETSQGVPTNTSWNKALDIAKKEVGQNNNISPDIILGMKKIAEIPLNQSELWELTQHYCSHSTTADDERGYSDDSDTDNDVRMTREGSKKSNSPTGVVESRFSRKRYKPVQRIETYPKIKLIVDDLKVCRKDGSILTIFRQLIFLEKHLEDPNEIEDVFFEIA